MTSTPTPSPEAHPAVLRQGLHVFTDGCVEPGTGDGGWAYVVYRDGLEIASGCGGVVKTANNAMEIMAVLEAVNWIGSNAAEEPVVIWSDSLYAIRGCNAFRQIWKGNGWKKIDANPNLRRRKIAHAEIWKALDLKLSQNAFISIEWCKGHFGIDGNERADGLADQGRRTIQRPGGRT
ncbi:ribonuclease H family protein [Rhizobium tumorigenes]|uniref:ribonuclease H n=1 Tax=Rhizobium tumorigenes TaxID=2041385 RepID=A0AAF1K3F6_9HYPH|nr:ribonuclease H [Rhizobium tumorigenes]WFR94756.1 ribonuclease HI [Rhizobium tumorigenes]